MSAFFCRKLGFFPKKYPYSKQQCESCGRDFLVLFSVFVRQKVTVNGNINFANSLSRIWLWGCSKLAKILKNDNVVTIFWYVIVNLFWHFLFPLSSLVTGPSFMSVSSLVLELWQFSFIRDWPEIRKSEIFLSEFCPISRDWYELQYQGRHKCL